MSRAAKGVVLIALLAGIAVCVRTLALGREAVWMPALSQAAARLVFRSLTIAMGLVAWFVSQSLLGAQDVCEGGIGDAIHEWTAPLNRWLGRNTRAANALLIVTSGFIDLFGLFLIGSALFGPSLRPGIALLVLFVFRQVAQLTCALPPPPGMIWRHPGFPTLLVTYDVANDFFFSGHTALAVLAAIEVAKVAPEWLAIAAAAVATFQAAIVLILRAHYTMDVLTAVVAAVCAEVLASRLCVGF
jgi:PAP2 superfamily C-terminal